MNALDKLVTAASFLAGVAVMAFLVICVGSVAKGLAFLFCLGYGC